MVCNNINKSLESWIERSTSLQKLGVSVCFDSLASMLNEIPSKEFLQAFTTKGVVEIFYDINTKLGRFERNIGTVSELIFDTDNCLSRLLAEYFKMGAEEFNKTTDKVALDVFLRLVYTLELFFEDYDMQISMDDLYKLDLSSYGINDFCINNGKFETNSEFDIEKTSLRREVYGLTETFNSCSGLKTIKLNNLTINPLRVNVTDFDEKGVDLCLDSSVCYLCEGTEVIEIGFTGIPVCLNYKDIVYSHPLLIDLSGSLRSLKLSGINIAFDKDIIDQYKFISYTKGDDSFHITIENTTTPNEWKEFLENFVRGTQNSFEIKATSNKHALL